MVYEGVQTAVAALPAGAPGRAWMTRTTHRTILLVEDDDDVLEAIRDVLVEVGYEVIETRSGFEAMAALESGPTPAAMIVDFMMAGMNGADFLKSCAADATLARIPALVISAGRPADLAAEGIESYISKPFRPDQLLDALDRLLSVGEAMSG